MVNNYKRKTERASWSENTMQRAIAEARKSTIKSASQKFGIPFSTLQRRVKSGIFKKSLGRFKPVFTNQQEQDLVKHIKDLDALFYGLSRVELLALAGTYAKQQKITVPFKNDVAGKQWFKNFLKRHPDIVLRSPEPTSIARLTAFNKPAVTRFYDLLETTVEEHNITPNMIYNMDETGVRTSSTKPPKVLSVYGKKQVGVVSSLERGTLTTVICCCSATGSFAPPPFFIFKRKRFQPRLLDGAPTGSEASVSDSGWVSGPIFLEWLRAFVAYVRPTCDCKALLILDNHESHKFYPALEYARDHNVIFLSIPPHTSHKLQPLDVAVYAPFKVAFEIEVNKFQKQNPGRVISQYEIVRLVTPAYLKIATPQNAMSGFRAAGIFPFDRNVIDEALYAPSTVYEEAFAPKEHGPPSPSLLPEPEAALPTVERHPPKTPPMISSVQPEETTPPGLKTPPILSTIQPDETTPPNLKTPPISGPVLPDKISRQGVETSSKLTAINLISETTSTVQGSCTIQEDLSTTILTNEATTPGSTILSLIHPLPQQQSKLKIKRCRKVQKSEILTSTPIKTQQEEKFKKATLKINLSMATASVSGLNKKRADKKSKPKKKMNNPKTKCDKENIDKEYYCTICRELFTSPPMEDWIQCSQCGEWTHENCSSYSGHGSYFCDFCFD